MQFDSDLVHSLCWQRTSSIIWLRGRVSSPPLSCYSVFPASLSFLLICLSCYSVFPATLFFLLLCLSWYSMFPATLCFLLLCVPCYSVFPATLTFLLFCVSCYSVYPATLCYQMLRGVIVKRSRSRCAVNHLNVIAVESTQCTPVIGVRNEIN